MPLDSDRKTELVRGPESASLVPCGCSDLAPEDAVADKRVEQHQWEDDQPAPPEHERKTGWRRGRRAEGDYKGDPVGPERQRQRAERRHEDQRDRVERPMVIVTEDTE